MDYFIDESGNTGDLTRASFESHFDDQPIFSLAAVGVLAPLELQKEIERLKPLHGVQGAELKAKGLHSKSKFIHDLLQYVRDNDYPVFLELMDKKFMICAKIVNSHLLPALRGVSFGPDNQLALNLMADCIFHEAPDEVFLTYLEACRDPSGSSVRRSLQALGAMPLVGDRRGLIFATGHYARESLKLFDELSRADTAAFLRFLPEPDDSKRGTPVWMLPNLSALTNIYARINLFTKRDLSSVRLVHDAQDHFDEILKIAKAQTEGLGEVARSIYAPAADYEMVNKASMVFASSSDSIGIQLADVVAGFAMRYLRNWSEGRRSDRFAREAFEMLLDMGNPATGLGINFMVSTPIFDELYATHLER